MKHRMNTMIVSALLVAASSSAMAGTLPGLAYDHVYDPINGELPTAVATPWTLSGGDPISSVSGEIATFSIASDGFYGRFAGDGVALDGSGYTLDFRVDPIADPSTSFFFEVLIDDPNDTGSLLEIRLRESGGNHYMEIREEGKGVRASGNVALDDGLHTYRFTRLGNIFSVYVDANPAAVLTGSLTTNSFTGGTERILFGDLGGAIVGSGEVDWIAIDQDTANFSAPVPEPASLGLLTAGGLMMLRRNRR